MCVKYFSYFFYLCLFDVLKISSGITFLHSFIKYLILERDKTKPNVDF